MNCWQMAADRDSGSPNTESDSTSADDDVRNKKEEKNW